MKPIIRVIFFGVVLLILAAVSGWVIHKKMAEYRQHTHYSVEDRLQQYEPVAGARVKAYFDKAGVAYPPARLVLVGLKAEKELQIFAPGPDGALRFVHTYPILNASGVAGPKLQEGDGQVPEGIYAIESLNPNSLYHLALRVNYPNDFDRAQAAKEGRTDLGGDIMIHGKAGSIGCLAMGDPASEEIFIVAARTGIANIRLILSPVDFRIHSLPSPMPAVPVWTGPLYDAIRKELAALPEPHPAL